MSFNWKITAMESDSDWGVYSVHIYCSKTETIGGEEYVEDFAYVTEFEPDSTSSDFIPYANLTEEIVLGWAHIVSENNNPKQTVEAMIEASLSEKRNTSAPQALPW